MEVVAARPFNHIGPRQTGDFIAATVARQLAEIEAEAKEPVLELGNLDSQRDFLDVRDVVRAYQVILDAGTPGVTYNVCSGEPRFIKEIVAMLLELSSLAPELKQDPSRMRPSDTPVVYGDNSRLTGLGWKPEVDIRQSLEDVLDYWRQVVAVEAAAGSKD
jgi:GDP-4-dehydro-6-deoxy-D-mannose reductase